MKIIFLTILGIYSLTNVNGQKYSSISSLPNVPSFKFTHNSALEMMQDREFIIASTKTYLDFVEQAIAAKQLEDSAITPVIIRSMAQANIILGKYVKAEKLYEEYLAKRSDFKLAAFPNLAFLMVKNGKEKTYREALFKKANEFPLKTKDQMIPRYYAIDFPKDNLASILNYASADTFRYFNAIKTNLPFFQKNERKLNVTEIIKVIQTYSNRVIADTLQSDIYDMQLNIKVAVKIEAAKWNKVWESKLYKFSKTEKLHNVIACNYQVFNKSLFPKKNIWTNPNEIPNNGIDDDNNGIVDDINGYQYKQSNQTIKESVALTFKDRDSVAFMNEFSVVLKNYPNGRTLTEYYYEQFDHGNMALELMIKNNPSVQFMAIEHNQYTGWISSIKNSFTEDISHNQFLVDSIVSLFTKSWLEMAIYCNANNVKTVEINSIGGTEDDFIIEGCGKTKEETKAFANLLYNKYIAEMTVAYSKASNTLFINAAGNDNRNVDSIPNIGTAIHLPNVLVVGALYKDLKKASYSDYGQGVDVFAPAHFLLPLTKAYSYFDTTSNGSSAAAPVVANLAIQLFTLNSKMTASKAKQLIIQGIDKEPYEKGINIINPKKTVALLKQN